MKIKNEKKEIKIKNPITIDYENKRLSVFYFLPLLLIAGLVPLIVYAKYVDLSGTTQALYWTGQQQYLDFFSYWKSRWVIVLTAIALIFYIILYKQKKLPFKNLKQYYIQLGIYAIFVIISTIFAIDTQTALWGFVDMYQGMFVLLSYVIITFLTINFVNNERDVKLFVNAFLFLMIIEGVIGVGQYFGFDIFQTKIGNELILPNNLKVDNLSFSFGPRTIYGTLFNTNFVGSFAALMLPLSVAFLLGAKTIKQRIISSIATILMVFVWIGCNSRAGYLGVAISSVFGIWLFRKIIFKKWKLAVSFLLTILFFVLALNFTSSGAVFNRIKTFNIVEQIKEVKTYNETALKFKEIILSKDKLTIKTNEETLSLKRDTNKLFFLDENDHELEITNNGKEIKINNPNYKGYIIQMSENYQGFTVKRGSYWGYQAINFIFTENGIKVLSSGGRLAEPIIADRMLELDGLDRFMSGRGYIWSRAIPMISNYIITGSGADNFPLVFPQDDIVAKLNASWDANMVIDKPHNMYMQIAINTGLISLIALMIIWVMYIINCLKLFSRIVYDSFYKYMGASCFISVLGYMIAGLFNDNIVSVMPLFCIVLGLGININYKLNLDNKSNNNDDL